MKLAILALLLPVSSFAADITCTTNGAFADIQVKIRAEKPLDEAYTVVNVSASGMRHQNFLTRVVDASRPNENELVVRLQQVNSYFIDMPSGVLAKITLNLAKNEGREDVTSGLIEIEQGVGRVQGNYTLRDCQGSL